MIEDELSKKIIKRFNDYKIDINEEQASQFCKYLLLIKEWNEKFNLTTIVDEDEIIDKHFLDSALPYKIFSNKSKLIDIGAGAGFPSIPLKILKPSIEVVLVDSVGKKVLFLNEVIKQLRLTSTFAIHSRIEDLANKSEYREKFDYCVSRAVSKFNTLCEYALPFVKIEGQMIAYKSSAIEEELDNSKNAIKILGGKLNQVLDFSFDAYERKIIIIKKILKTDSKYPRGNNKPRLKPL